jgi:cytochrome c peroxidase
MNLAEYVMAAKVIALLICVTAGIVSVGWLDDDEKTVPVLPKDTMPDVIVWDEVPVGFEELPAAPADNPMTEEKVRLGRRLFFDPILSQDGTVACASCHQPEFGFASPDEFPIGLNGAKGRRNAPSILNRVYGTSFSWDGRNATLEEQVLGPLTNGDELGNDLDAVIQSLRSESSYRTQFRDAFADELGEEEVEKLINRETLALALACFERTLVSGNSAVDRFRASEYEALSKSARQGLWIFESRGGCWKCHSGANFSDEKFHNTGVGFGQPDRDEGRFEFSEAPNDRFKFKTPTLREVEHTAPYMHDGSLKTLQEVVEFYNKGGNPDDPNLDKKMKPLKLTDEEVGFLLEFLKALSGGGVPVHNN